MENTSSPSRKIEPNQIDAPRRSWVPRPLRRFCTNHPFVGIFLIVILSNAAGAIFNLAYNNELVAERKMDAAQKAVFYGQAIPIYNSLAWLVGLGWLAMLIAPLARCRRRMQKKEWVPYKELEYCQIRLVNLPFYLLIINAGCWLPGAIFFPVWVTSFGGSNEVAFIWAQFSVSFVVSALLTAVQTFFFFELYLIAFLYRDFFRDRRPADIEGPFRFFTFRMHMFVLWLAVAVMPLIAVTAVAVNIAVDPTNSVVKNIVLAASVFLAVWITGALIFFWVGRDIWHWLQTQSKATEQIAKEKLDIYIAEKRPDEWGKLIDRFNDMVVALKKGREAHDTFGQFVGPEARDVIMDRYPGLGGQTQEVTVLFADIRGFTSRTSGESPDAVFQLLNRFITLAVKAMEDKRGWVNKFLGDGIMVLFGAPLPGNADDAVSSAMDLLVQLEHFNQELHKQNEPPIVIGIGIHTGSAMVGCVGASLEIPGGHKRVRRELTAIGETVNLCQRIEQLTKKCGGPILISEQTKKSLKRQFALENLGPQELPGSSEKTVIYRVKSDNGGNAIVS